MTDWYHEPDEDDEYTCECGREKDIIWWDGEEILKCSECDKEWWEGPPCPHGNSAGDCEDCARESDFQYDADRERRFFG